MDEITQELQVKLDKLKEYISGAGSLAVAFSGGVDSTFLLAVANEVLGQNVLAISCATPSVPPREIEEARIFCEINHIRQIVCNINTLCNKDFISNPPDRCYHCKKQVFTEIRRIAYENGIEIIADGSNVDDTGDYRPGQKVLEEMSVVSPLKKLGFTKLEIREISKAMGLPTWYKPTYSCLATRIAYGEEITEKKLKMIDEAEQYLIDHGFRLERVRMHGNLARIEVPNDDIERIFAEKNRLELVAKLKEIGFTYVSLDLEGFRPGSMNEAISVL